MEYGVTHTKNTTVTKYNSITGRFDKNRYTRYSSVSVMLDEMAASFSKDTAGSFVFTKLLTVWHKCPAKVSLLLVVCVNCVKL